ncbi:hypothetical protein VR41_12825, partial [Streptomyces sp. NRRL B-1568]
RRHRDPGRRTGQLPVGQPQAHRLFMQHQRAPAHPGGQAGWDGDVAAGGFIFAADIILSGLLERRIFPVATVANAIPSAGAIPRILTFPIWLTGAMEVRPVEPGSFV